MSATAAATGLRLVPVTPENFDAAVAVKVRRDQEHLVAPVMKSLAQAYVFGAAAWQRLILDGDRVVGFLMAFLDVDWSRGAAAGPDLRSGLWRLNIGQAEQRRSHGRFAVEEVAAEIRRRGGTRMYVSYHPGPSGPQDFYLGLGFRPTGETTGDQTVAVRDLA
jgi:diamine N-acetyltransferase